MKTLTQQEAIEQGFTIDRHCYPNTAYKGPRFTPTEYRHVESDREMELRLEIERLTAELAEAKQLAADRLEQMEAWRDAANTLQIHAIEYKTELIASRANDKCAMGYLSDVRKIVGGDDFPDMVKRVAECKADAERYRWFREASNGMPAWAETDSAWDHLDAAIDAAMKENKS